MDNTNPVPQPQPSTSAQAKKNDKMKNQYQDSNPPKKPRRDEVNLASISSVLAVTPAGNEKGNKLRFIYGLHNIVKQFGKVGSKEDLELLRCLSKDYYKELNTIYWDEDPHRMEIKLHEKHGFPIIQILNMDNDRESVKYFEELPKYPFDNRAREIEKIVHTFRALIIAKVRWADLNSTQLNLITLISPHIKYLNWLGIKILTPQELVEIMEQFTNLKSCKIVYSDDLRAHFEMILQRFSSSIKFEISIYYIVGSNIPPIFNRFGGTPNVRWTVHITNYAMLEEIRTIYAPLFLQWPKLNINFDIHLWINSFEELRTTAQICLDYQDKINKLHLYINLMHVPDQDEEAVKACLGVLRSLQIQIAGVLGKKKGFI